MGNLSLAEKRIPSDSKRTRGLLCLTITSAALALGLAAQGRAAEMKLSTPPADRILKTLKPGHPRLIIDSEALARVKKLIQTDPIAARWYAKIRTDADTILGKPASEYEKPDGRRLLQVSRKVNDRVETLAFVYLLEGDRRYVDRVWKEIDAAAKFPDWNPVHFLDTSEMTYGFALAYDWLYDLWTAEQRREMREAIVNFGLKPAMKVYKSEHGWHKNDNNWNQVCNGGIGLGALAIADEQPALSSQILHEALQSLPRAMSHYAPDGAGTEGVMYWSYGTKYNLLLLSGLETALGTDFGLSKIDGFGVSGDYQLYLSGANRVSFNFSDCGLSRLSTPQHFWLARRYHCPQYSWFRYSELSDPERTGGLLDLLWYDDSGRDFDPAKLPLDKYFRGAECASMRSSWSDPNAMILAIEAGDNSGGHRHEDLGSFILDAQGERWAIDNGTDHQTYLKHQHHNPKWDYYRVRAEGHNTLVINPGKGPDQDPKAKANIVKFGSTPARAEAVVDLTKAYANDAKRVVRTFATIDRKRLTVSDEIETKAPAEVWWFLHTTADVALSGDGRAATLSKNKGEKRLSVAIVEPKGAVFTVMDAKPLPTSPNPEKQASNKGRRKLAVHLTNATNVTIAVELMPFIQSKP